MPFFRIVVAASLLMWASAAGAKDEAPPTDVLSETPWERLDETVNIRTGQCSSRAGLSRGWATPPTLRNIFKGSFPSMFSPD